MAQRRPVPTSHDIARRAGVSQATVSRVLSNSTNVREETRAKVVEALVELDYVPNVLAQAIRTRRTGAIAVVVASLTNPFYPQLLEAIGIALAAADYRMVLWDSEGPGESAAVESIRQSFVDGLLFTTSTHLSAPLREALRGHAPVVLVNRGVEAYPCTQVISDNRAGGRRVARYFRSYGHDRLALIDGPRHAATASERREGFLSELSGERQAVTLHHEDGDFTHERARSVMLRLMGLDEPPTAVFCVNDLSALGACDGARAAGVAVPEDVWVVGYDDIWMASWDSYDLTTMRQPIAEMGQLAVRYLLEEIERTDQEPRVHRFSNDLIVRGTTARAPDPPRANTG